MVNFFASLYEWFGLMRLYARDLGDFLRGWDITCTNFIATPWYVYIGWTMIILTSFSYALQYHIIDNSRFNKRRHWWLIAFLIFILNFLIAFSIPYNSIQADDYCKDLTITTSDCLGFGLSNAIWSLILFLIITTIPLIRKFSTNCRHTTFWKP